jgi:hypothetical protein
MHFDELVWGGSGSVEVQNIFKSIKQEGADVHVIPREISGTAEHETVDQALQLSMYRHARKYRDTPGTMVVCTGDGKGYEKEKGFLFDLEGFLKDGWEVIVFSWDCACHDKLREFAASSGKFVLLDDHYQSITFIEGGRTASDVGS